jgi:hypothetical protein
MRILTQDDPVPAQSPVGARPVKGIAELVRQRKGTLQRLGHLATTRSPGMNLRLRQSRDKFELLTLVRVRRARRNGDGAFGPAYVLVEERGELLW